MKRLLYIIAVILGLSLISCDNGGEYVIENGQVLWSYWTFSFGTLKDTVYGADTTTFESLSYCYGKDKNHVYREDKMIRGASPATFKPHNKYLGEDDKDFYWKGFAVNVSDKKSFEVLYDEEKDASWAKDAKYGYFIFFDEFVKFPIADSKSFRPAPYPTEGFVLKSYTYAVDKYKAYYEGIEVTGADAASFKQIDTNIAQDKNRIYYKSQPTDITDYSKIQTIESDSLYTDSLYIYDKNYKRVGRFGK